MSLIQFDAVQSLRALAVKEPPAVYTSRPENDYHHGRSYQAQSSTRRFLASHCDCRGEHKSRNQQHYSKHEYCLRNHPLVPEISRNDPGRTNQAKRKDTPDKQMNSN